MRIHQGMLAASATWPDVWGKGRAPVGQRCDKLDGKPPDGIGADDQGRSRFVDLGADGGVEIHQPDFAARWRNATGRQDPLLANPVAA